MRDELEDRRLLDEVDAGSDESATQPSIDEAREAETHAEPAVRRKPNFTVFRIAGLVIALILGSLLVLLFALNRHTSGAPFDDSQLAIPLHPSEHSTRDPTTLTFDWHITLGTRAPDGVEKQVYLVNGA